MEYNILESAIFVPISAKVGTNLEVLKEKILDIVFKQKELENQRYIEHDEWLELEEEERLNEAISGQKEKEKMIEVDLSDDIYSLRNNSSSAGVLLDIVKSRKLGTTLHVVIRRGEVRLNQYDLCKSFFPISKNHSLLNLLVFFPLFQYSTFLFIYLYIFLFKLI